jgi:hypothetical protein
MDFDFVLKTVASIMRPTQPMRSSLM